MKPLTDCKKLREDTVERRVRVQPCRQWTVRLTAEQAAEKLNAEGLGRQYGLQPVLFDSYGVKSSLSRSCVRHKRLEKRTSGAKALLSAIAMRHG